MLINKAYDVSLSVAFSFVFDDETLNKTVIIKVGDVVTADYVATDGTKATINGKITNITTDLVRGSNKISIKSITIDGSEKYLSNNIIINYDILLDLSLYIEPTP
jgi:hypothetical protein